MGMLNKKKSPERKQRAIDCKTNFQFELVWIRSYNNRFNQSPGAYAPGSTLF